MKKINRRKLEESFTAKDRERARRFGMVCIGCGRHTAHLMRGYCRECWGEMEGSYSEYN